MLKPNGAQLDHDCSVATAQMQHGTALLGNQVAAVRPRFGGAGEAVRAEKTRCA